MKTVLILGAGASLANGQHFHKVRMRNTLPPLDTTFFETALGNKKIQLGVALRVYLRTVLGLDTSLSALREQRMEEVFADVFYDFAETPTDKIRLAAYTELVELYMRVIADTTNWLGDNKRKSAPIGKLLAAAAKHSDELTVITFNHDLVIENEIYKRPALASRWCLDDSYGRLSGALDPLVATGPGSSFAFNLHSDGQCDHTRPITLLKLHGSLNWTVRLGSKRPTANLLSGSRAKTMFLLNKREVNLGGRYVRASTGKGRKQWNLWPIVVPPVYSKGPLRESLLESWADARSAVEEADRLVVFGYSLPPIDIEAEKLFERGITRNGSLAKIVVVNPAHDSAARFAGVGKRRPLHWYPSVDALLETDDLS